MALDAMSHPLFTGTQNVGMVTAQAPRFPSQVQGENAAMSQELHGMGLRHEETDGSYGGPERSFIVYNPTREQMFDLGRRYGQEAVVFSDAGKHELLYTNGPNSGKASPGVGQEVFPEPPEDYYTRLPGAGFVRLSFDDSQLQDRLPLLKAGPLVLWVPALPLRKSVGDRAHPHAYPWHDPSTSQHPRVCAPGVILVHGVPLGKADPLNDQAAGVGAPDYGSFALPWGALQPGVKTDLFHYPLHGRLADVQALVRGHGYQVYYAGGRFGRPDLASRNYNTKHLMIYDPTPELGGDFGDRDYTDAWRQSHELAHAETYPELNQVWGEGRRIGRLGVHRTPHEAQRAVHWEWLAAHRQRELLGSIGVHIPDEVFHRELGTVMHDAVYRAVTGKFTDPAKEGFAPYSHKVPLETALGMVREHAQRLGLGQHELLAQRPVLKTQSSPGRSTMSDPVTLPQMCQDLAKSLQAKVDAHVKSLTSLRERELAALGKKEDNILPGEKQVGDLPGDSKPAKVEWDGAGGDVERGKALKKMVKKAVKKAAKKYAKAAKAEVPTAPAPTKEPTAPHPVSKPGSPVVGKSEQDVQLERLHRAAQKIGAGALRKALPKLKDAMASDPRAAQGPAPAAPEAPAPRLAPEAQANRAQMFHDFTPAGAFDVPGKGAVAGPMKPAAGLLDRFHAAYRGGTAKAEMKPAVCPTCKKAHDGLC